MPEEEKAVFNTLCIFENMVEVSPPIAEQVRLRGTIYGYGVQLTPPPLCARLQHFCGALRLCPGSGLQPSGFGRAFTGAALQSGVGWGGGACPEFNAERVCCEQVHTVRRGGWLQLKHTFFDIGDLKHRSPNSECALQVACRWSLPLFSLS